MEKIVNVYPQRPIMAFNPPIRCVIRKTRMTTEEIRKCLMERAMVDEVLEDGSTVKLTIENFDKNNSLSAIDKAKKEAEAAAAKKAAEEKAKKEQEAAGRKTKEEAEKKAKEEAEKAKKAAEEEAARKKAEEDAELEAMLKEEEEQKAAEKAAKEDKNTK